MDQPSPNLVPFDSSEPPDTRLRGWRLAVAHVLVFTTMAFIIGLFALTLPGLASRLATPCADALNTCLIAPQQVAPLARLGITPHALALAVVALSCLAMLLASGVAAVLVWRRSDDWMALLVAGVHPAVVGTRRCVAGTCPGCPGRWPHRSAAAGRALSLWPLRAALALAAGLRGSGGRRERGTHTVPAD